MNRKKELFKNIDNWWSVYVVHLLLTKARKLQTRCNYNINVGNGREITTMPQIIMNSNNKFNSYLHRDKPMPIANNFRKKTIKFWRLKKKCNEICFYLTCRIFYFPLFRYSKCIENYVVVMMAKNLRAHRNRYTYLHWSKHNKKNNNNKNVKYKTCTHFVRS